MIRIFVLYSLLMIRGSVVSNRFLLTLIYRTPQNKNNPSALWPAMHPSCQPASWVLSISESFVYGEGVGRCAGHCCDPWRCYLTSTTQHLIHCLVESSEPLVLQKNKRVKLREQKSLNEGSNEQINTFSCGVEATRVKLSSGHVIFRA